MPSQKFSLLTPATPITVIAIADTFGGLIQGIFPATLFLRTAMVSFLLIYILLFSTLKQGFRIIWLALISYFFIRIMVDFFIFRELKVLLLEMSATLKILYFPLLFTYLNCIFLEGKISKSTIRRILSIYGWLILASLMLGHLTGLGGTIGGRGVDMDGGKGFMIGANEVGLMLLLTTPFVGADMMHFLRSTWLGGLAQIMVYAMAGWHVFTKSSLIAVLTSAVSVYRALVKSGRYSKWLIRIILLGFGIYLIMQIPRNLEVINAFALDTFFGALLNDGVVAFLFRGRQDYISAIYPQLVGHDLSALFVLFGAGEFYIRELSIGPLMLDQGEGTTFEMDLFDLVGAYGLIGLLLFGAVVTFMLRMAGPNRMPFDIKIVVFCILAHALMAGHVLFSPQVTTLLALILLYYRDVHGRLLHQPNP